MDTYLGLDPWPPLHRGILELNVDQAVSVDFEHLPPGNLSFKLAGDRATFTAIFIKEAFSAGGQ